MDPLKDYIVNENNFFKNLGVGQEAQIKKWLDSHGMNNYKINSDMTIDIKDVYFNNPNEVDVIPDYIQFRKITRHCDLSFTRIKKISGMPEYCGKFWCTNCNELTSLEGCPKRVGDFECQNCKFLKSLKGCPKEVAGLFSCYDCGVEFTYDDIRKVCDVKGAIMI